MHLFGGQGAAAGEGGIRQVKAPRTSRPTATWPLGHVPDRDMGGHGAAADGEQPDGQPTDGEQADRHRANGRYPQREGADRQQAHSQGADAENAQTQDAEGEAAACDKSNGHQTGGHIADGQNTGGPAVFPGPGDCNAPGAGPCRVRALLYSMTGP